MNLKPQRMPRITYPAPDPARPYVYPGTPVLINLFDIRKGDVLERVVDALAGLRGEQLDTGTQAGSFDLAHLCTMHRTLFQDVYAWAGELRTVDTEKQGQDFLPAADISLEFMRLHEALVGEGYLRGLGQEAFADRLAGYYDRIYAVHPFRDGNSRALRHFCSALALAAGYRLDFSAVERGALLAACRDRYFRQDSGPLRACMHRIVHPV